MSDRKYASITHDVYNGKAIIVSSRETVFRDGITERNINELVKSITDLGYHVTLYVCKSPQYFAESNT
jgi:hypothetical protein